jgi:hypothetical protein
VQRNITRRRWATVVGLAFLLLLAGCDRGPGYPSARLTGRVTLDGQPIPEGKIMFRPVDRGAGPVVGTTFADGAYIADDVPLGKINVQLVATRETGNMVPLWPNDPQGAQVPEMVDLIPERYKLGIEIVVEGDDEGLDFELQSDG